MYRRRGRGGNIGLFLLAMQFARTGLHTIPIVTLIVCGVNIGIYMFNPLHLSIQEYYNIASFIWKGRQLERELGAEAFLVVIIVLSIGSNVILVGISYALSEFFSYHQPMYTCAVGFSAVLFGLKVLLTASARPGQQSRVMFGFSVPTRYVAWIELVIISILVPNASFLGHLAGILAGFILLRLFNPYRWRLRLGRPGPYYPPPRPQPRRHIRNGILY